jgi:hypothetical protein
MGMMGQPPEVCSTRCDEAAIAHTTPSLGAGAEVTEEVAPGEVQYSVAATAATNGSSDTTRKARKKRKGGQQSRLSANARKRYRKSLDKT